jgi:hypothetical protein
VRWLNSCLACQHLNSGMILRESEYHSWIEVQAVAVFRFDWCIVFSRTPLNVFTYSRGYVHLNLGLLLWRRETCFMVSERDAHLVTPSVLMTSIVAILFLPTGSLSVKRSKEHKSFENWMCFLPQVTCGDASVCSLRMAYSQSLAHRGKEKQIYPYNNVEALRVVRNRGSRIFYAVGSKMAVKLSALCTGRLLVPGRFLVFISVRCSGKLRKYFGSKD